ncbi:hypothetical protein NP233_g7465 [Leucocoprinus birnbaumii]|uniref:GATA-type domain-containing protein n=1 Tax=Leucocoprinus birnbaumii TaxID=56174 RepID=A0AAD5YUK6_9AGAR|nr:hypothetical protein NP233_g7465 [Leucocoprinus birnbaumii]
MEFLPPEDAPKGPEGKNYLYTRVRLAWYYRPSDVSDRTVADSRLLLAAIYSEVCDINQLRGKCYVVHRDKISDLAGWKKRPDRFYFNRLFDPYIKKEFEVIQSTDVRNLPDRIREVLTSRYEYIVAEKEVVADLTDNIRLCATCNDWCPSLLSKPSPLEGTVGPARLVLASTKRKSIATMCAIPLRPLHVDQMRRRQEGGVGPARTGRRLSAKRIFQSNTSTYGHSDILGEFSYVLIDLHGSLLRDGAYDYADTIDARQYTVAEDTLDPEDLIFPRTATRQGPKYQANVPPAPDPYNHPPDIDERGGDNTVEVLGIMNSLTEAEGSDTSHVLLFQKLPKVRNRPSFSEKEAEAYGILSHFSDWTSTPSSSVESCKRSLTNDKKLQTSVDWLTEVIRRFSEAALAARPFTAVSMKNNIRVDKWTKEETPYRDEGWTRDEIIAFEDAIMHHNAELRAVRDEVVTRTMPEVVRFYGHWKNLKLGEQTKRIKETGEPPKPVRRRYRTDEEASNGQRVGLSDDETSIVAEPASRTPTCGACRTRESPTWWKAPKGLSTSILCENCGTAWRKYADLNLVRQSRDESLSSSKTRSSANDKREGTPLSGPTTKRAKVNDLFYVSVGPVDAPSAALHRSANSLPGVYQDRSIRQGTKMSEMRNPGPRW